MTHKLGFASIDFNYFYFNPFSIGESIIIRKFILNTIFNHRNATIIQNDNIDDMSSSSSSIFVEYNNIGMIILLISMCISYWLHGCIIQYIKLGIVYGNIGLFGYIITPIIKIILQAEFHEKSKQESINIRCCYNIQQRRRKKSSSYNIGMYNDEDQKLWDR